MEAVEFQAVVKDGMIKIPETYQTVLTEGTVIKVILLKQQREEYIQAFKALLKETQALPQSQTITEEEIAAEIAAYRASNSQYGNSASIGRDV